MSDLLFPSDAGQKPSRFPIVAIAVFLALSLAGLRAKHEGWQGADDRFDIAAERWDLGAPLPWTSWTKVRTTGDAPPMETLPDGREYLPGLRIHPLGLALALLCAAGLGWILAAGWPRLRDALARRDALPSPLALALFGVFGSLFGLLTRWIELGWLGVVFLLVPLPVLLVWSCWKRPRTALALAYLLGWLLGLEFVLLFEEGRPLVDRAFDPKVDLDVPAVLLLELPLAAALLALLRRARRLKGHSIAEPHSGS